jgi:hypothetical protein
MRTNGESAVATVCGSDPGTYHVMLLDICMPHMDGYQVAQLIRLVPYHTHTHTRVNAPLTSCSMFTGPVHCRACACVCLAQSCVHMTAANSVALACAIVFRRPYHETKCLKVAGPSASHDPRCTVSKVVTCRAPT